MKKMGRFLFHSKVAFILFIEIVTGVMSSVGLAIIFAKISKEVIGQDTHFLDVVISRFIYYLRTPWLTDVMIFITDFGAGYTLIGLMAIIILLLIKKHRKEAVLFSIISTMGLIINFFLKNTVQRPRPILSQLIEETSYSFPSGHAMNSFVFYATLSFYVFHFTRHKTFSTLFTTFSILLVTLIGFSRVYLGVHYPSDIIAGYCVGFWWLTTAFFIEKTLVFFKLFKETEKG